MPVVAKKKEDPKGKGKGSRKKYVIPVLVSHGLLASLAEKVAGLSIAG